MSNLVETMRDNRRQVFSREYTNVPVAESENVRRCAGIYGGKLRQTKKRSGICMQMRDKIKLNQGVSWFRVS